MSVVVFRCDAGPEIGIGHAMRCLALAHAVAAQRAAVAFAVGPGTTVPALGRSGYRIFEVPSGADAAEAIGCEVGSQDAMLVVDNYRLDRTFEHACRSFAKRILVIDDLGGRDHDCDILVDPDLDGDRSDLRRAAPGAEILIGPAYAPLRPGFAQARVAALARHETADSMRRVFVSFGGSDPVNATGAALGALRTLPAEIMIDVAIGSGAPHLAALRECETGNVTVHVDVADPERLMAEADLAIGAAGVTAIERCVLGLPSLLISIADNQLRMAAALERAGAAINLGRIGAEIWPALISRCAEFAAHPRRLAAMSARAAVVSDGRGAVRVAAALLAESPAKSMSIH